LRFLRYPKDIKEFIYTTNQIEKLVKEIKSELRISGKIDTMQTVDHVSTSVKVKLLFFAFFSLTLSHLSPQL